MIILDTHIWIWWVNNSPRLTDQQRSHINQYQLDVIVATSRILQSPLLTADGKILAYPDAITLS